MKKNVFDSSLFYSYQRIDSYNAAFNFVIGERGNGKTYGAKYKVIKNFIKKKEEFIYLRRYQEELHTFSTFFDDIRDKFPQYEFRTVGRTAQIRKNGVEKWTSFGTAIALSTSQMIKSSSFPKVSTIIYDEFIIEKGVLRYLTDEVRVMLGFYNTVDRYTDKTKVYFLANAVSIANPYFVYFTIDISPKIRRYFDGFVAVEFCNSREYIEEVEKTRYGKFLRQVDPKYAEYVMDNSFNDNGSTFIEKKSPSLIPMMNLETKLGKMSVWLHPVNYKIIHVQNGVIKNHHYNFTVMLDAVRPDWTHIEHNNPLIQRLRYSYRNGYMTFDKPQTRVVFNELMKRW